MGHSGQETLPAALDALPGRQAAQSAAELDPVRLLAEPGGHDRQEVGAWPV